MIKIILIACVLFSGCASVDDVYVQEIAEDLAAQPNRPFSCGPSHPDPDVTCCCGTICCCWQQGGPTICSGGN